MICSSFCFSLFVYLAGVVRESGAIKKCFDEFYEDFIISDELRKVRSHSVLPCEITKNMSMCF